jgi:TolA-binding protein
MIKAISVLVVGIAFVLSGCYPRPTLRVPPEKKVVQDEFYLAELDYEAGNYDKAIENYQLYLNENPKGEKSRVALYRMAKINEERYLYHKALSQLEQITFIRPYPNWNKSLWNTRVTPNCPL